MSETERCEMTEAIAAFNKQRETIRLLREDGERLLKYAQKANKGHEWQYGWTDPDIDKDIARHTALMKQLDGGE